MFKLHNGRTLVRYSVMSGALVLLISTLMSGGLAAAQLEQEMAAFGMVTFERELDAPEGTAVTPGGKKLRLSDYRGRLILLNFWATW